MQFDRVFSSKQNFELSSFNYNNVYDEQVIKDVLNNLELDQLNLLDKSIEQLLVGKPTLKQNLLLNSENFSFNLIYDDVYDERVIKNALNNLELDQLNLLDKSIEQLLVGKKIAEQNIEWNNSIVVTSNLDSDIYDYNLSIGLIP
ncbi:hypothetical protein [Spiroplasma endosymbiont of Monopis laevigella]|uniref:hypothetical protein n=1 Tax=Spiroplasma endosymbiont of Monopis laevigella TaxID=3066312 RepID=UPI0030CBE9BC